MGGGGKKYIKLNAKLRKKIKEGCCELIKPVLQGSTSVTRELSLSLGSVSDRFHPDMSAGSFSRRGITKATVANS